MKLFADVADATWFAAGVCCPSFSKPVCTREESRHKELCKSPLLPEEVDELVEDEAADVDVLVFEDVLVTAFPEVVEVD